MDKKLYKKLPRKPGKLRQKILHNRFAKGEQRQIRHSEMQRYKMLKHKAKCLLLLIYAKILTICVAVIIYDNEFAMVKK